MTDIVGINGFAGAGKDEAARALIGVVGYTRIAFADVLRDMAYAVDPFVNVTEAQSYPREHRRQFFQTLSPVGDWYDESGGEVFIRLQKLVDAVGWDVAKNEFEDVRRLLQRLGTEGGRDILGENIWVDTAFSRASASKIVVTDVRFPNEADGIRERGGTVIKVTRPGVGPRNNHPSETSLLDYDFDHVISNDGTIEELHRKVLNIL